MENFDLLKFAATIESAKEAIKFIHISGVENADVAREIQDKVYKALIAYENYVSYLHRKNIHEVNHVDNTF